MSPRAPIEVASRPRKSQKSNGRKSGDPKKKEPNRIAPRSRSNAPPHAHGHRPRARRALFPRRDPPDLRAGVRRDDDGLPRQRRQEPGVAGHRARKRPGCPRRHPRRSVLRGDARWGRTRALVLGARVLQPGDHRRAHAPRRGPRREGPGGQATRSDGPGATDDVRSSRGRRGRVRVRARRGRRRRVHH